MQKWKVLQCSTASSVRRYCGAISVIANDRNLQLTGQVQLTEKHRGNISISPHFSQTGVVCYLFYYDLILKSKG